MRRIHVLLAWLLLAAGAWALQARHALQTEPSEARRIHYALSMGQEVVYRLRPGEPRICIMAHLETWTSLEADESRSWPLGMQVLIEPTGSTAYSREIHSRSRLTLLPGGGSAILPLRRDHAVTDARLVVLEPGHLLPQGGDLRIRPLLEEPDQRLLLRVYRETPTKAEVLERFQQVPAARFEPPDHAYEPPWTGLRKFAGRQPWKRTWLHAKGTTGESVALHKLRAPSAVPSTLTRGLLLQPGEGTALNLTGPSTVSVQAEWTEKRAQEGTPNLQAQLVAIPPESGEAADPGAMRFSVPEGATWSLQWTNPWQQAPLRLRLLVSPQERLWGNPIVGLGERSLLPELRQLTAFRAGPRQSPLSLPVSSEQDWGKLRIESRPLPSQAWLADPQREPAPVLLSYRALDRRGEELAAGERQLRFTHSPFERYAHAEPAHMSEATSFDLYHSGRVAQVDFSADAPVDLRFMTPTGALPQRAAAYALPEGWQARHAPWQMAPYVTLAPEGIEELAAQGRVVSFLATVRIEAAPQSEDPHQATRELRPRGEQPRYPLVERQDRAARSWRAWHRTRLGETTEILIPADGILVTDYRVAAEDVGGSANLSCGGATSTQLLSSSAGTLSFSSLPSGLRTCELDARGEFLARAAGSGERWSRHGAYRGDEGELSLPVQLLQGQPTELYVRAYTPRGSPAPCISLRVDGGTPARRGALVGQLTRAARDVCPPPSGRRARLEDRSEGWLEVWQGVALELKEDLHPGWHQVAVKARSTQSGQPVYLRFEATRTPSQEKAPSHWTRR